LTVGTTSREMAEHEDGMAVALRRKRFTLDEYHRMGEVGILHEDDRVELIEGEIVEMTPIGSRHAATVGRIHNVLARVLGERAIVWSQNPVILPHLVSVPQPDALVLAPRADGYARALPEPSDVRLLVEVADSSLAYDRGLKIPLYARAGVAEVWLVDVEARDITAHRAPGGRRYADVRSVRIDRRLAPLAFPDISVAVAELIP
jgi:Uma2 family endonuclease